MSVCKWVSVSVFHEREERSEGIVSLDPFLSHGPPPPKEISRIVVEGERTQTDRLA